MLRLALVLLKAGCLGFADEQSGSTLLFKAYTSQGQALSSSGFLNHIGPADRKDTGPDGIFITDMDGNPIDGRPRLDARAPRPTLHWRGGKRVRISFPWPISEDGFSYVVIDKEGMGYGNGEEILLNREIALTQYRLFQKYFDQRRGVWIPPYRPGKEFLRLRQETTSAIARAKAATADPERAVLYERALRQISLAWAKMLFEHGTQIARDTSSDTKLRWGLTLDVSLLDRLSDHKKIFERLRESGADWVRLVFRLNPEDFLFAREASFIEYDSIVAELNRLDLRILGSVLDSVLWPKNLTPESLAERTRHLVLHYKGRIHSWEVGSELNGNWLGGYRTPLTENDILSSFTRAAQEVKQIDPTLETVATLYWWEGTAPNADKATFSWLKRSIARDAFRSIDVIGLNVFPDENPMGMSLDPVFHQLGELLPKQKLMLGAFGYANAEEFKGYWWLDPKDAESARKDLLILYTGAACAMPRSLGGGFWWTTLSQMFPANGRPSDLAKVHRRTLLRLRR